MPAVLLGLYYPGYPLVGSSMILAFTLLLSPVITYIRLRARSIFAAALFRGTLLALWPVGVDLVAEDAVLVEPPYGATGLVMAALCLVGLYLFDRFVAETPIMTAQPLFETERP